MSLAFAQVNAPIISSKILQNIAPIKLPDCMQRQAVYVTSEHFLIQQLRLSWLIYI